MKPEDYNELETCTKEKEQIAQAIVDKLAQHDIPLEIRDIIIGAAFTRYVFDVLSPNVRIYDLRNYVDEIKLCAQTTEDIMIDAPYNGEYAVAIDIVNTERRLVSLYRLLESDEFVNAKGELSFVLGEDVYGKTVVADLTKLPHMLVAGSTGAGKSVFLDGVIVSLASKYSPEHVRFVMADPKFVELSRFNGLPHMLTPKAVTAMSDMLASMDYLIDEMERRYTLFSQLGVPHIRDYNNSPQVKAEQKLPYLVLVVDELSDMMLVNKAASEVRIMRLAQKSRAAGIHMILATQRPDSKVITGTIKANMPCRAAFKVCSSYDSQTVLNSNGAEKLSGHGDMLFMDSSSVKLNRLQCAFISGAEVSVYLKNATEQYKANFDKAVIDSIFVSDNVSNDELVEQKPIRIISDEDELKPYYKKALRFWLERNSGKASISSIQRSLGVGFNRAGRILENLQKMGYVEEYPRNPSDSVRALNVLVTLDELDDLFPDED